MPHTVRPAMDRTSDYTVIASSDASISKNRPIAARGWPAPHARTFTLRHYAYAISLQTEAFALGLGSTFPTTIFTAWLHPQVTCKKMRLGNTSRKGATCGEGTSHCNANVRFSSADQPVALIANFQFQTASHRHRTANLQIPHALPHTLALQGNLGLS